MPRSSVFVRLNWPSKSDESSFEGEGSPQIQGSLPSPSYANREKTSSSDSGDSSSEKKSSHHESPLFSACIPSTTTGREEAYTCTKSNPESHATKYALEKGTKVFQQYSYDGQVSPDSTTSVYPPKGINLHRTEFPGPCNDDHHGYVSPQHETIMEECSPHSSALSYNSSRRPEGGSLKGNKPKTKPKPRNLVNKGRRITRSLSASCVSVSTNTDPRDFVELAKTSATLPIRRRIKNPKNNSPRLKENKAVSCSLDTEDLFQAEVNSSLTPSGGDQNVCHTLKNGVEQSGHPPAPVVFQNVGTNPCVDGDFKYDFQVCNTFGSASPPNNLEDINSERCSGDGCDDEKGYIELQTYVPSGDKIHGYSNKGGTCSPCTLLTSDENPFVALLSNTFEDLSVEDAPYIDDEIVTTLTYPHDEQKFQTSSECSIDVFPRDDKLCKPTSSEYSGVPSLLSSETLVHHFDLVSDGVDIVPMSACNDHAGQYTDGDDDHSKENIITKDYYDSEEGFLPPVHWSPVPKHQYLVEAKACRQLEKDISIESCPDVVLQTLESDGLSVANRTQKKTVTFLLPPEHWDSLISLRENNLGGYPQSGYAELDSALLPPNGQDPYRNTPSPGLHGVPQDRYDPGLEGDYPEDGRYPGNDPGIGGMPSDGVVVYGRLLGTTPRSPYALNGGVGSSAEPLLPSPGMYEEEPLNAQQHPAPPPPHMSPTPSLPPPVQNHDNYAHPSLLRSPSADSGAPRVRWRDPDLHEVIDFLSNPNNVVKANAAAYLQHLCYMDDPTKQKTRILGGIPPLVALLSHDLPELHRNACGALRNLSYGRQNDENKRAIKDASGIPALVRLLRKTPDNEIKELVTGILWNLSSCEDLKHSIIDDALSVIVSHVIIPCSGWDGGEVERDPNVDVWWSTVFKNASGVLRNVSSAGEYARTKLRQCPGLVDSLLTVIKSAIAGASHDNKSVENCVCILRNLSYRCQEVEDPNYDKNHPPTQSRATATAKDGEGEGTDTCGRSSEPKDNLCDNLGCFGGSRKKKDPVGGALKETTTGHFNWAKQKINPKNMELLWQPEVVVGPYLSLLSDCSNPETLEAAAGALQNLAACYWQPSIDVRASVRKEKGLPILVELLRMEVDRVVCAVATALRNLAIDQRNKELIGKYAMRELVQKLPSGNTHDTGTSDETIAAVLATLNEVIKKNAEFSRSLLDFGGVERLVNMTRLRGRYSVRVVKFASQVLFSMWGHQELREVYKKAGWKEQDFVSKSVAARNAAGGGANSPTANNTLNRPMASQGGTRYEDRTIQRGQGKTHQQREQLPMSDMGYGGDGGIVPPAGGVRLYPPVQGIGVPQH
ncbi:plakophilin-4 isoform X7 [Macrobrachium rosenbergii]|uniref:plakophilin-4 isoform X7 n=1 Tax=Macrobrachium rosenbergii TaxID=79674 RepID=UPI0034D64E84